MQLTTGKIQDRGHGGDTGRRIVVNEPGLYKLVLKSRKPEAAKFMRWITHIVLPEIRRTGVFLYATADMSDEKIMARAAVLGKQTIDKLRGIIWGIKTEGGSVGPFS